MSIKYVEEWPKQIGVTWNPSPEQCRAAGYELLANRPAEEVAAEQAQRAVMAQEMADSIAAHADKVRGIRAKYRSATRALCRDVGISEADAMTADQLETLLLGILDDGDTTAKLKRNTKALAHLVKLLLLTMALKEEDGRDALDRI